MGKGLLSSSPHLNYAHFASTELKSARRPSAKPLLASPKHSSPSPSSAGGQRMEASERVPLSEVVADCVRRWFQDTLKEARAGDTAMQVLVGQMYHSGYGVARNEQKAKTWLSKASRYRSSVWKVSDKHPGYNASDSDSEEARDD